MQKITCRRSSANVCAVQGVTFSAEVGANEERDWGMK